MLIKDVEKILTEVDFRAKSRTTCTKTWVGCVLGKIEQGLFVKFSSGYNSSPTWDCTAHGPYKEIMFGKPEGRCRDWCKAIHAEENAMLHCIDKNLKPTIAIVTRYPCEKCATLLVHNGIKEVYYGRPFKISQETEEILENAGVKITHIYSWKGSDVNDTN